MLKPQVWYPELNLYLILLLTDFKEDSFLKALGHDFEEFISAGRNVIVQSGYAMLAILTAIVIIHICGSILFFFLKTRYKFPVHRIYISSCPPQGGALLRSLPPVSDSEDEDHESGFKRYPTRVHAGSQDQEYARTDTLLTDFKYSETKV